MLTYTQKLLRYEHTLAWLTVEIAELQGTLISVCDGHEANARLTLLKEMRERLVAPEPDELLDTSVRVVLAKPEDPADDGLPLQPAGWELAQQEEST